MAEGVDGINFVSPKVQSCNSVVWVVRFTSPGQPSETTQIIYNDSDWYIQYNKPRKIALYTTRSLTNEKPLWHRFSFESTKGKVMWTSSIADVPLHWTLSSEERKPRFRCGPQQTIPHYVILSMQLGAYTGIKYVLKLTFFHKITDFSNPSPMLDESLTDLTELSENMQEMLTINDDFDVTLTVKETDLKAHKCILTARSPVFKRMFQQDMVEHKTAQVEITDCDPDAFRTYLLYLYSGKVKITLDNVIPLHYIADKYQSVQLFQRCVAFLKSNFTVESFFDLASLALTRGDVELLRSAASFLAKHFASIINSEKWKAFIQENPMQANELLSQIPKIC